MRQKVNKKIYRALAIVHAVERRAILLALALILALCAAYAYFVVSAIVSTVVYKDVKVDISKLHSEIATLESTYIANKNNITNELATSIGLAALTNKTFIKRTVHVGRAE